MTKQTTMLSRQEVPAPYTTEEDYKTDRECGSNLWCGKNLLHRANVGKVFWMYTFNYAFYIKSDQLLGDQTNTFREDVW